MTKENESFLKEMGARIRDQRIRLGISQIDLAKKIGYSNRSSLIKLEKGEIDPSQSKMVALAKALKTTPGYLMGWDEERNEIDSQFGDHDANVEYLQNDPDLLAKYLDLVSNDQVGVLFDKVGKLTPKQLKAVLAVIDAIDKEEE